MRAALVALILVGATLAFAPNASAACEPRPGDPTPVCPGTFTDPDSPTGRIIWKLTHPCQDPKCE